MLKDPKGLTDAFCGCEKVEGTLWFGLYLYLKDNAFTAFKKDAKF